MSRRTLLSCKNYRESHSNCQLGPPCCMQEFNVQMQKVSPCHRNCHFSRGKTRIGEVRLGPLHVLYPSRPMLVLTSTCKEWAPVTGTVTFPKEKRRSPRSALARCTFSLQKSWKSMDREHSGLTLGPLGEQIAWRFSFRVQT